MFGQKIFADHRDHADIGEAACGQREVRCRAAEDLRSFAVRRLNAVERHGPNYQNRHVPAFFLVNFATESRVLHARGARTKSSYRYLLRIGLSFSLVASGTSLRSVRMAYFNASAQAHVRSCGMAATAAFTTFAAFSAFWCSTATIWSTVTSSWPSRQP